MIITINGVPVDLTAATIAITTPQAPVPAPAPSGTHAVVAAVTDAAGVAWSAQATVGNDSTMAAQYVELKNAAGAAHAGLTAWFYADGVDVAVTRADCAYDYINCTMVITYDGVVVPHAPSSKAGGTLDFWRGCRNPTTRYGAQVVPTGANIDWTILPSYAKEPQTPFDDSKMDFTFNGLGNATSTAMGTTGEREEIGYMSVPNMAFICNQSAADWAVVRRADDFAGNWPVYFSDPVTGRIIDRTVYPNANVLSAMQQGGIKNNPIVPYGGTYNGSTLTPPSSAWHVTGCKFVPNGAHLTGYGLLSAMLTKTARDRDHASFWSNWVLLELGPTATYAGGVVMGAQRRFAWCLRNLFMASYVSSDCAYFAAETARNLAIANALPQNAFGILNTYLGYPGTGSAAAYKGVSQWMQSYLAITLDAVSYKLPEWKPFAQYIAKLALEWFNHPWPMLGTLYTLVCCDASGAVIPDFKQIVFNSLVSNGWLDADATALLATTAVQDAYNLVLAHGGWDGKCVNGVSDFIQYDSAPDGYPADLIAAVVAAVDCGAPNSAAALAYINALPTPPSYTACQKDHLVPRA